MESLPYHVELESKHNVIFQEALMKRVNYLELTSISHDREIVLMWFLLAVNLGLFAGLMIKAKKIQEASNER